MNVSRLLPGVTLFTSSFWQMNTIVARSPGARCVWVIDPGYHPAEIEAALRGVAEAVAAAEAPEAVEAVEAAEAVEAVEAAEAVETATGEPAGEATQAGQRACPVYCAFTHSDFDHIVGAADVADRFGVRVRTVGHESMLEVDAARVLDEIERLDDRFYIDRTHAPRFPGLDVRLGLPAGTAGPDAEHEKKGSELDPGSMRVEDALLVWTPGHTRDSICIAFPELSTLVCGDMLSDLELPLVDHDPDAYLRSLHRVARAVQALDIRTLVPGHGRPARSGEEIRSRIRADARYLEDLIAAARTAAGTDTGHGDDGGHDTGHGRGDLELEDVKVEDVASAVGYRGSPVSPRLAEQHRANVRLALRSARP